MWIAMSEPQQWVKHAAQAFCQVASMTMSLDGRIGGECEPGQRGAFIPLVASQRALQIGVTADHATCVALTRLMLQMGGHESPTDREVIDALGEMANMTAGTAKSMSKLDLALGLPIIFDGHISTSDRMEIHSVEVVVGTLHVAVTVIAAR